jgi:hypothetical protein
MTVQAQKLLKTHLALQVHVGFRRYQPLHHLCVAQQRCLHERRPPTLCIRKSANAPIRRHQYGPALFLALTLSWAFMSAPAAVRSFTTSAWLFMDASMSAVSASYKETGRRHNKASKFQQQNHMHRLSPNLVLQVNVRPCGQQWVHDGCKAGLARFHERRPPIL